MDAEKVELIIEPISKRVMVQKGTSVFEALNKLSVQVNAICGGKGTCKQCLIRIISKKDTVNAISENEIKRLSKSELDDGVRLACQTTVLKNAKVFLNEGFIGNASQILTKGTKLKFKMRPKFWKILVYVKKCVNFTNTVSDFERLKAAINQEIPMIGVYNRTMETTFQCLRKIPEIIREEEGLVTVTLESYIAMSTDPILILNIESGNTLNHIYGIAFDIGTTTVVGYLLDLRQGRVLGVEAMLNPQTSIGEDIITRMDFVSKSEENTLKAQNLIHEAMNTIIEKLSIKADIEMMSIAEITIVGNTAMHHILFGLPVHFLGRNPFPPVIRESITIRNYHLNLKNLSKNSEIYSAPLIAGFVGGDTIADIIATKMHILKPMTLLIDIGTNGEMVLGNQENGLKAASCAAGSALEGAHIRNGMRATNGAIELIKINPETWIPSVEVIGNKKPFGLCGSAIVDIIAEMIRAEIITRSGNFNKKSDKFQNHPRIRKRDDGYEYIICSPELILLDNNGAEIEASNEIVFTQSDVREFQKAKGAFLSGARLLIESFDNEKVEIEQILIAGAFGTYIHKENALFIGLFPDIALDKIIQIGNAAGEGSKTLLMNTDLRVLAEELSHSVGYVEIAGNPNFQKEFAESMIFPHKNLDVFPSIESEYKDKPYR
jgi:uncharacterized 2Fe-2S/4Fe-4S cluster protein (DUF4445 family)